jgi:hypothetical protein
VLYGKKQKHNKTHFSLLIFSSLQLSVITSICVDYEGAEFVLDNIFDSLHQAMFESEADEAGSHGVDHGSDCL